MRLAASLTVLAMMALWQSLWPRRRLRFGLRRWPANLGIVALDAMLARLLIPGGALGAAAWAEARGFGLFHWLDAPPWVAFGASVVSLDGLIYAQHVLFHAVPVLWRLHMVHHADQDIDVTTGLRFHPIEILLSLSIKMAAVALLGAPVGAVLVFEMILNGMAMFNHANARLPAWLDATLRLLVVTPDMHRVHHSVLREETNSNYGFNLSIWDRLFDTYRAAPKAGHEGITIGLAQYQMREPGGLAWMLALPFTGCPGVYPFLGGGEGATDEKEGGT